MSANVDSVKAMYECFGRGDVAGILARLDPDIEWEHDWGMPPPSLFQERRGREAVAGYFAVLAELEFIRFEPVAFLEGGGMVCALIRLEVRHKGTGRVLRDLVGHLWSFGADGLAKRYRHLADTRQFAWAAGEG